MEWYNTIRHSVDCRLMTRFPKKVLLAQARVLQSEYYKSCLLNGLEPQCVLINNRWLIRFMDEYSIASRRPNRKFKVARWVLAERLKIYWLNVAKLRKLILLKFGYDPPMRSVDQSPFHQNEAGSKEHNTLTLQGAQTLPAIEIHALSTTRWSLNPANGSDARRA